MIPQHDLATRLAQLGDELDFDDDPRLPDRVLARLHGPAPGPSRKRVLIGIAAAVLTASTAVVAVPDARHAVARWFGLAGVDIRIEPDLSLPPPSPTFDAPGPGESRVVVVDGHEVLVSAVSGALDEILIGKSVGASEQVTQLDVDGRVGLWVSGGPHEVMYVALDGTVLVERVAANTLLWQDGDVLYRVEGFTDLAAAVAFAKGVPGT